MPIIRKVLKVGDSKGITLPRSWFEWIERQNGEEVTEVTIEVDNVLIVSPILPKKVSPILPKREGETCAACKFWAGRCLRDQINRIARTDACELFEYRDNGGEK